MNMIKYKSEKEISNIFSVIGNPFRVKLLYAIGNGEACVCHLEAVLKKRQVYISQHLMVLRDAGILETRRDGKYIFYRVADEKMFSLIETAATIAGTSTDDLHKFAESGKHASCNCPKCAPEFSNETFSENEV
jgi:DNA-binding transcriptional ArsR family regulator